MTLEFKLRYVTVLITLNRSRSVDVRFLAASQIPWIKGRCAILLSSSYGRLHFAAHSRFALLITLG